MHLPVACCSSGWHEELWTAAPRACRLDAEQRQRQQETHQHGSHCRAQNSPGSRPARLKKGRPRWRTLLTCTAHPMHAPAGGSTKSNWTREAPSDGWPASFHWCSPAITSGCNASGPQRRPPLPPPAWRLAPPPPPPSFLASRQRSPSARIPVIAHTFAFIPRHSWPGLPAQSRCCKQPAPCGLCSHFCQSAARGGSRAGQGAAMR